MAVSSVALFAKEIQNSKLAVYEASAGDYITLPNGNRYVLTQAEIDIMRGQFNYADLEACPSVTLPDGTQVVTISIGHTAYAYEDGAETHVIKSSASFEPFFTYLKGKFHLVPYYANPSTRLDEMSVSKPSFTAFRASVEFQTISNGEDDQTAVWVKVFNDAYGKSWVMALASSDTLVWGNSGAGGSSYSATGQSHSVEFDN
jgi:hypothetical protein